MPLQKRPDVSSEIFASFTMSKIDRKIIDSMTAEQVEAVRAALLAADRGKRHPIDIRLNIPLYFASYYLVLFAGRDKRRGTLLKEAMRKNVQDKRGGTMMILLIGMLIMFGLLLFGLLTAYFIKSEMGIDIFPNKHLEDLIFEWLN